MASASATFSPSTAIGAVASSGVRVQKRTSKVVYIRGLNSFGGLKAQNNAVSLGLPVCTEQAFADVVNSFKATGLAGKGSGGLSAKCNAIGEIFKIAAIMNGLTLVGVAVGFVLLRIEAFVEESEE